MAHEKVNKSDLSQGESLDAGFERSSYRASLFDFFASGSSCQLPKYPFVTNYHDGEAILQKEIYKILPNFTYADGVPERFEGTAETIAEIFTITRESDPATKRF
ncbi:uncharacterized protein Bfra_001993 [Botrytis fragariae]|uniref:Uncharacterized protein n=1 Tax=Botrytis fragariae TaxID=1964551 RepID=A0A8H6B1K5_9HELO|nr:uncharacterized protein Bfra_001993 [Botrytis fragariae]KAF5877626.1 hypothetical protein Bfra_001993 [Botrytis fragariae]